MTVTVTELRAKAKLLKIKGYSRMTKSVLEAAIAAAENPATDVTVPAGWDSVDTSVEDDTPPTAAAPEPPIKVWNDPRLLALPKGERRRFRRALRKAA